MSNTNSSGSCTLGCWALGIVAGLLAAIILMTIGDWRFIAAVFAGIVIAIILGALLSWILCRPLQSISTGAGAAMATAATGAVAASAAAPAAAAEASSTAPKSAPSDKTAPSDNSAPSDSGPAVKPSATLSGQAELDDRKGEWKYEGDGAADAKPAAKAKAKAKAKPKAKAATKPKPAAAAPAASDKGEDYDGDGVLEGADEGSRPATMDGPRGGKADNLKEIKGIGPKLEKVCNSLGFYHFDQIANWTADEVAWVNANLEGFKGRVSRDEWVAQAKVLAAGGETEFSKRVEDGGVY